MVSCGFVVARPSGPFGPIGAGIRHGIVRPLWKPPGFTNVRARTAVTQEVGPVHVPQRSRAREHWNREELPLFGSSVLVSQWGPPDALGGVLALALICLPWVLIGWLLWMVA